MINAIDALLRRWQSRQADLNNQIGAAPGPFNRACLTTERDAIFQCVTELRDTVTGVKPAPLTEASNEKLYRWAGRMVAVLDLMIQARDGEHPDEVSEELGELASQDFLNDFYDLFKQLANRQSGA